MARTSTPEPADWLSDDVGITPVQDGVGHTMVTIRQVVAYNLARARKARGLTQEELGRRLSELTGTPWSRATVSAAESGWEGKTGRVRHFDVDELVALAIALRLPVSWFLFPPPGGPSEGKGLDVLERPWITMDKHDEGDRLAMTSSDLKELILTLDDDEDDPDRLMRTRMESEVFGHTYDDRVSAVRVRSARDDLERALSKLQGMEEGGLG